MECTKINSLQDIHQAAASFRRDEVTNKQTNNLTASFKAFFYKHGISNLAFQPDSQELTDSRDPSLPPPTPPPPSPDLVSNSSVEKSTKTEECKPVGKQKKQKSLHFYFPSQEEKYIPPQPNKDPPILKQQKNSFYLEIPKEPYNCGVPSTSNISKESSGSLSPSPPSIPIPPPMPSLPDFHLKLPPLSLAPATATAPDSDSEQKETVHESQSQPFNLNQDPCKL